MKVCFLTKYDELGASSRVRAYAYRDRLAVHGIECHYAPLFDRDYLLGRYRTGRGSFRSVAGALTRGIARLSSLSGFDALWLEYELFPYIPAVLERLLRASGLPFVVDYDDAIFHTYDLNSSFLVRHLIGHKIDAVMRSATVVTVANDYLAARATKAGAQKIVHLPTVVDLARYPEQAPPSALGPFRIGWIGSPATEPYLQGIREALCLLAAEMPIEIILIGVDNKRDPRAPLAGLPVRHIPWSVETEVADLARIDVGVMPLPDEPWARGKSAYKLLQYMAAGKPGIASPVGANTSVVQPGVNGLLASNTAEWLAAFRTLAGNAQARLRMGVEARKFVASNYTYDQTTPVLAGVLKGLVGWGGRAPGRPACGKRR